MPTIFNNLNGYRIFFYSLDRGEPIHVHIEKDNRDEIMRKWYEHFGRKN